MKAVLLTGALAVMLGACGAMAGPRNAGTWVPMRSKDAPPAAQDRITVWTGDELVVFSPGGGGRFDPERNRWTPLSVEGMPEELIGDWDSSRHTPVFTGRWLVFLYPKKFGSLAQYGSEFVAAIYDMAEDRWTAVPFTEDAPCPRKFPVTVWTGEQVLVWGGVGEEFVEGAGNRPVPLGDGAALDPATGTWTPMSSDGAPSPRSAAAGIWTGSRLWIWGGLSRQANASQLCFGRNNVCEAATGGGLYDPASDSWETIRVDGAPAPRADPWVSMMDGSVLVVGGSGAQGGHCVDGGLYHPATDTWTPVRAGAGLHGSPRPFIDSGRLVVHGSKHHVGVWDFETQQWTKLGNEELPPRTGVAGRPIGDPGMLRIATPNPKKPDLPGTVSRIDAATATWQSAPFPDEAPPVPLETINAVWTGERLIFWGGWSRVHDPEGSNGCGDVQGRPCDPFIPTKQLWSSEGVMFEPVFDADPR